MNQKHKKAKIVNDAANGHFAEIIVLSLEESLIKPNVVYAFLSLCHWR